MKDKSNYNILADMPVLRYGVHRHFKDFIYVFRNRYNFPNVFSSKQLFVIFRFSLDIVYYFAIICQILTIVYYSEF